MHTKRAITDDSGSFLLLNYTYSKYRAITSLPRDRHATGRYACTSHLPTAGEITP